MISTPLRAYYLLKRFIPRRLQIELRRWVVFHKLRDKSHSWPIDEQAGTPPPGWKGWPKDKRFAFVLTHDVDTQTGHDRCLQLANLEKGLGFKSSFNFVIGDYKVSSALRKELLEEGFEVGVHGLTHNASLFSSRSEFLRQAVIINKTLKKWGATGFRSPSMYKNLDWLHDLDIEYDSSTFDTDPFEPQPDGLRTIFPLFMNRNSCHSGYVELPYTLPQDFTLFILLRERTIETWKKKLAWIAAMGGLCLVNVHPDYMQLGKSQTGYQEYPPEIYSSFLAHVASEYRNEYWHALPREIANFVAQKYKTQLNNRT